MFWCVLLDLVRPVAAATYPNWGFFRIKLKKPSTPLQGTALGIFFIAEVSPGSLLYVTKQRLRNGPPTPIYHVPGIYMPWRAANWSVTGPSYSKNVLVKRST